MAVPIVSDCFLSGTKDVQWTDDSVYARLSQGYGKVYAGHTTTTGDRRAGYKSATGCVLSGDFDIQINFEASSSTISATGDGVYGRFLITSVSDVNKNIDVRNSRLYGYFNDDWLMLALINNGNLNRPENLRGYPAVALRAVRTGTALYAYGRPMQQGGDGLLVPVGDGEWTLIQSIPSGFTGDATVSFVTCATGTGTITSTWQDFKIAHPALVSDNFQSSTKNDQWTNESLNATSLYQGYGKVYAGHNTTTGDRRAGYKSTTDYVLSGDFDVRINFDAYASAIGATGDTVYGRFLISSIRDATKNIDIRNVRSYGYLDGNWLMLALINDGNISRPENLRGYPAVAFRAVRKGTTLYAYGRPMQQGSNGLLAPVGNGEWTLIQSVPNCFTEEATVSFVTHAAGSGTIGSTWQSFDLFVESTTVPMPVFSPAGPEIDAPTQVTMSCATEGVNIYYTTDGTTPATHPTDRTFLYTEPFIVNPGTTLKAIAVKEKETLTIVGYGDSITLCMQVDEEDRWLNKVQQALAQTFPMYTITVINSGVGGNTSREGLARIDQDVIAHNPDYVFVEFGGNDATENPARHVEPEEFSVNLDMIHSALAQKTHAQVALVTFPPVIDEYHIWGTSPFFVAAGGLDHYIEQYRQRTRDYSCRNHLPLIDIDVLLRATIDRTQDPVSPCILADGVHLTAQGSQLVADEVIDFLQEAIAAKTGFEHSDVTSVSYVAPVTNPDLPGDADKNGAVDVGDLGILAANYGVTSGATWTMGDFTGDGAVDVGDLGILAANYGSSGSSFEADYAKVFGQNVSDDADDTQDPPSSMCIGLGLPLMTGLLFMGLLLVKKVGTVIL